MIRTLVLAGSRSGPTLEPWLNYLARTGQVNVELVSETSPLAHLDGFDVVVAHAPGGPLGPTEEASLCRFVAGGGGFVGLHCTNHHWAGGSSYRAMMGGRPNGSTPLGELVVDVAAGGHAVTRRVGGRFTVWDSCFGEPELAGDAEVLLTTTWRSQVVPVAYARSHGSGRVFHCGLGESAATFGSEAVQGILYRALRHVTGLQEESVVGVGLVGYGAIAPEHTRAIAAVPGLSLAAVCDRDPLRLQEAARDGDVPLLTGDADELLASPDVGMVVISTPPITHAPLALRALRAGKHVVVEKPFCMRAAEADELLEARSASGKVLTVYQNRRWDPDFLALQRIFRDDVLGEVFHIEAFVGGFDHPCHFWHSDSRVSGGVVFDWGAHYLDWILQLLPFPVVRVDASRQKRVWHDVSNDDQFEIRLTFENGAEVSFLHSDIAAARKPKWYVLGTRAAVVGHWREATLSARGPNGVVEEHLPVADLPCELHIMRPAGDGLVSDERIALGASPQAAFYRNLAGHVLAQEPLAVTPESARRNIQVMEEALAAADSGQPRSVRI